MPKTIKINIFLPAVIISLVFFVSYLVFAQDSFSNTGTIEEGVATEGIAFPIGELGNCTNKGECKKYCEESANIPACVDFAKRHGLMNEEEAKKAQNFAEVIKGGGGPGGCQNPRDCESFCRNIDNIETCVAFAEKNNIKDKHVDQGKRILSYIRSGGQMPGGCNSKESCDSYCGDFSHAEECYNFAKRSGIVQDGRGGPGDEDLEEGLPPPEQFQKFLDLAKRGETPGACKSKQECESYCRSGNNFEECVAFGEKMGFMTPDQAVMARKTGGKGPGGCDSPQACQNFCNDPANQETCFKFAEENGLVPKEDLERAKEGFVRMRQGLEQAPPEVAACLKSVVGEKALDDIQAGRFVPGPEIGERVRQCFMKHGGEVNPSRPFQDAPAEVKSCLREKLGDNFDKIQNSKSFPTPEMADTFRVCFQQFRVFEGGGESGPDADSTGGFGSPPPQMIQNFIRTAPPEIAPCLKEKLGDDFEKIAAGESAPALDFHERLRTCFDSFKPPMQRFNKEQGEFEKPVSPQGFDESGSGETRFGSELPNRPGSQGIIPNFSGVQSLPQVVECVKNLVGVEQAEKFISGEKPSIELEGKIKNCVDSFVGGMNNQQPPPLLSPAGPNMPQPPQYPQQPYPMPRQYEGQPYPDYQQKPAEQQMQPHDPQYPQSYPGTFSPPPSSVPPPGGNLLKAFEPILEIFRASLQEQ